MCLLGQNGNGFDFDHQLFAGQFSDLHKCASRNILAVVFGANVSKRLNLRHVGDIRVDLDDVVERRANTGKCEFKVLEDLIGLGREVTLADDVAGFVERNLTGDVDGASAVDFHNMAIARWS